MDLTAALLELLAFPCVTGEEGPIADLLAARYAGEQVRRIGHSLVIGSAADDGRPLVALVGHTDVVPPTDADRVPHTEGDRIVGRGASDMKSGLVVAMDAFARHRGGRHRLLLVAYAGEEGPQAGNELGAVLDACPDLRAAALAVVLEPTDGTVQLGCMGALHAQITFTGRAAHSARPWQGDNALTKAAPFLAQLGARQPVDVAVDELVYREVVTATGAWTDNARNVVPDRFTVNANYRFAPDKTPEQAVALVHGLVAQRAVVEIADLVPAAPPRRDDATVAAFIRAVGATVEPKQAWTDVARFAQIGVPALNFGPGETAQAHQAGESVAVAALPAAARALDRFLGGL